MNRLLAWWLERTLPGDIREAFIGDLEELARSGSPWRVWWEVLHAPMFPRPTPHVPGPAKGDGMLTTLRFDLRYAARQLARQPAFTAIATLTLALGIGATTAIVSAVYPILVAPLPYPGGERIALVQEGHADGRFSRLGWTTSNDIAGASTSLESFAMFANWDGILTTRTEPERVHGQRVSAGFFRTLGVAPALGRDFTPEEDIRGAGRVAILSHGLWRSRFAGDTAILGRAIDIEGTPFTVVGVMPQGFEDLTEPTARLWTTLRYNTGFGDACRSCRHTRMLVRIKPGVALATLNAELATLATRLRTQYPQEYGRNTLAAVSLRSEIGAGVRSGLLALLGGVVLVLLIACANVSNLLLGRAAQRQGEFALRTALGAGGGRLLRQLLTESLLLTAIGGVLGVALAIGGVRVLVSLSPPELPRLSAIAINGPVLAAAAIATTLVGIVFGLVPALQVRRRELHASLQESAQRAGGGRHVARRGLVVAEMALALVLLVGSGLLIRSMSRLLAVPPGVDARGVLTMQVQTGGPRFQTREAALAFWDRVLEAVRAVPGVESAGLTSQLPLSGDYDGWGVHAEHPFGAGGGGVEAFRYTVTPGYLETMGIPVLRGRALTTADRDSGSMVALVSANFAATAFKGRDPIGERIHVGDTTRPWITIVGVVGDVRQTSLAEAVPNGVYVATPQWFFVDDAQSLVVRGTGDVATLVAPIRRAIWSVDKDQPIVRIATMERVVAATAAQRRFTLVLFEAFGLVALLLAAAGIYGVMSASVTERLHEVGVRAALGARANDIIGMILRQGLAMAAAGVALGTAGALALARLIRGLLFGVEPVDPLTYGMVAALLLAVAAAACAMPAWRAARVDPARVLRGE